MTRRSSGVLVEALGAREAVDPDGAALAGCTACARWELDPVEQRSPADEVARRKGERLAAVEESLGLVGFVARRQGEVVGHLLWSPAGLARGAQRLPTAPATPDALLLTSLQVAPAARGVGIGRSLVRAAVAECVRRRVGVLEAIGDSRPRPSAGEPQCLAPTDFWLRAGFHVQRPHPTMPRLRLDVDATVGWREEVDALWGRVSRAVRQPRPVADREPAPAAGLRRGPSPAAERAPENSTRPAPAR